MNTIYIKTGKDLLDSKIEHFKVVNGSWIGKVEIRNNHPWLYAYDEYGELVNSFEIKNNMILDLHIKKIDINEYEQKYQRLLTGEIIKGNKHTIYELMFIMNGELNINTISFQKSGRDTYYIRVDDPTKQYYREKFNIK